MSATNVYSGKRKLFVHSESVFSRQRHWTWFFVVVTHKRYVTTLEVLEHIILTPTVRSVLTLSLWDCLQTTNDKLICLLWCDLFNKVKQASVPGIKQGPSWPWSYGSWICNYLCNQCLSPLMVWVRISIRARCTTVCDKVCQWLATGRWISLGTPVSSTNKTDRHDIAEILLKLALDTIK